MYLYKKILLLGAPVKGCITGDGHITDGVDSRSCTVGACL